MTRLSQKDVIDKLDRDGPQTAPTRLPRRPPRGKQLTEGVQAYKTLQSTESRLLHSNDLAHDRPGDLLLEFTPPRARRVLGYALLFCPSATGRDALAAGIL